MTTTNWIELSDNERSRAWDRFYSRFKFRPSVEPQEWPGIREPTDSITYAIGHVYGNGEAAYAADTNDLGSKLMAAFRDIVSPDEALLALDWQHPCYHLYPHRNLDYEHVDAWPVPALPNGDYYIFLTQSMLNGVVGHPWEKTMCVFGFELRDAIAKDPPKLFSNVVRRGRRPR